MSVGLSLFLSENRLGQLVNQGTLSIRHFCSPIVPVVVFKFEACRRETNQRRLWILKHVFRSKSPSALFNSNARKWGTNGTFASGKLGKALLLRRHTDSALLTGKYVVGVLSWRVFRCWYLQVHFLANSSETYSTLQITVGVAEEIPKGIFIFCFFFD